MVLVALLVLGSLGVGYYAGNINRQTITTISTTLISTTLISTTTLVTATSYFTPTISYLYLSYVSPCQSSEGWVPCSEPGPDGTLIIFNCVGVAATPQGCTQVVKSSITGRPDITVNVRFPFINATTPSWAECLWTVTTTSTSVAFGYYGHCVFTNSTAFEVGTPAPITYPSGHVPPSTTTTSH